MSASDSFLAEVDHLRRENDAPDDVHALTSSLTFWEYAVPGWVLSAAFGGLLSLIAILADTTSLLWAIVPVLAAFLIWWSYRAYWAWAYRPLEGNAEAGVLEWNQRGPLWLGLSNSKKDAVQLDKVNTNPLEQSLRQRLFKCSTLELPDGRQIKNIKNADLDRINAIRDFKKGADIRELAQGELRLQLEIATLRQAELNNMLLTEIRDLLRSNSSHNTSSQEPRLEATLDDSISDSEQS